MKHEISNLGDLSDFLQSLKVKQLDQPIKIINLSHEPKAIVAAEITEEPFFTNGDEYGYSSELKREHGPRVDLSKYTILEPVGTIILHAE